MKNLYTLICISLFLGGCATQLKYEMNNVKYLTPETKGAFLKGDIGLGIQQTHKVVITEAFDTVIFSSTTVTNVNDVENGSQVSLPINLGLGSRIDFFTLDSKYGVKYQLVGAPENENQEGFKLAVAFAYGSDSPDSESVVYTNSTNTTSRTYSTAIDVKSLESTLILGYRVRPEFIGYATFFHDQYKYDGSLTSSQFSTVNASGKSYNNGLLLGMKAHTSGTSPNFFVKVEGGVVHGKIDGYDGKTSGVYGLNLGLGW